MDPDFVRRMCVPWWLCLAIEERKQGAVIFPHGDPAFWRWELTLLSMDRAFARSAK